MFLAALLSAFEYLASVILATIIGIVLIDSSSSSAGYRNLAL
jgi:hypothetical protein